MGKEFSMKPESVEPVDTPYRRIVTQIPVPDSLEILSDLHQKEPLSLRGQPQVIWDRAEGIQIYDPYGNKWLDFSSGVLVANAGHGRREIREAIIAQTEKGLIHNYVFPSEIRGRLAGRIAKLAPAGLDKAFLLTTGSEAVECAIKLARTHGLNRTGTKKNIIISFENAFHGRTLGAQMIGGIPALKTWIVHHDPDMHNVPFPGDFRLEDRSFDLFEKTLALKGIDPDHVCAVISETFQGGGASFFPDEYAVKLRQWCDVHGALLIFDEIQAAFGRTGKWFGFEHYGVVPDLTVLGKGITSSLPLSAVIGRAVIMDQYEPGSMTSTHTGNPVCCAAALANIKIIEDEGLVDNAAEVGIVLGEALEKLRADFADVIGTVHGRGLVYGLHIVKKGSKDSDPDLAFAVVDRTVKQGLMLFAPVGSNGGTVKICPPLIINKEAALDGVAALRKAFEEIL